MGDGKLAWVKNGTTTLGSAGDDLDIIDLSAKKINQIIIHAISNGDLGINRTFNNNGNTVYSRRHSINGGTDTTGISESSTDFNILTASDKFVIEYVCSMPNEEKLSIIFITTASGGAGVVPTRAEIVAKFVPSPDADITRYDLHNALSGDFATNSNVTALGTD